MNKWSEVDCVIFRFSILIVINRSGIVLAFIRLRLCNQHQQQVLFTSLLDRVSFSLRLKRKDQKMHGKLAENEVHSSICFWRLFSDSNIRVKMASSMLISNVFIVNEQSAHVPHESHCSSRFYELPWICVSNSRVEMEKYDRGEIIDKEVLLPFPEDIVGKNVPQLKVIVIYMWIGSTLYADNDKRLFRETFFF